MLLVILEKMVLTAGMRLGGRKPATTTTSIAAMRAYSIRSCPASSFHSLLSKVLMGQFHIEAGSEKWQPQKNSKLGRQSTLGYLYGLLTGQLGKSIVVRHLFEVLVRP